MVLLSITGLFKMLLIIIGITVLLRFIGRIMIAKRSLDEQNKHQASQRDREEAFRRSKENLGKTTISKIGKSRMNDGNFVDFEEVE